MKVAEKGQAERADRAAAEPFTRAVIRDSRNRKSQLLLVLTFFATFAGVCLAVFGNLVGFGLLLVGLPACVATSVWCIRNWDY